MHICGVKVYSAHLINKNYIRKKIYCIHVRCGLFIEGGYDNIEPYFFRNSYIVNYI